MAVSPKLILLLLVFAPIALCTCPDGWLHHGNSCYHFSHDTEAMLLASIACQHMGGDLVEIETAKESDYLTAKVTALKRNFWIGLTDIQEENIWVWYSSHKALEAQHYVNWDPSQPNNGGLDENCVVITPQQWHDEACRNYNRYICEKADESGVIVG